MISSKHESHLSLTPLSVLTDGNGGGHISLDMHKSTLVTVAKKERNRTCNIKWMVTYCIADQDLNDYSLG